MLSDNGLTLISLGLLQPVSSTTPETSIYAPLNAFFLYMKSVVAYLTVLNEESTYLSEYMCAYFDGYDFECRYFVEHSF